MKKRVVVGLSGGVDSSVSAWILKNQGYDVIGLFMKNWEDDGECPSAIDFEDVSGVCDVLKIPYYSVNFVKEYQENVFKEFLEESLAGRTPNPDILCNREIKFKAFYEKAKELGADYLATGHYCQLQEQEGHVYLKKGADPGKDQSYFLYAVKENVFKDVLFPIGHLPKKEVRALARKANLPVSEKKDSTGICFIGKRDFKDFLNQHLKAIPGLMMTQEGKVIGRHDGLPFYTIGQRKGLSIGGPGEAWFVVGKNLEKNIVYVEQGENHPSLFHTKLIAKNPTWVVAAPSLPFRCTAKVRYRQIDHCCLVESFGEQLLVTFEIPQRAITPGQSIVFYAGDICLGGAIIEQALN